MPKLKLFLDSRNSLMQLFQLVQKIKAPKTRNKYAVKYQQAWRLKSVLYTFHTRSEIISQNRQSYDGFN